MLDLQNISVHVQERKFRGSIREIRIALLKTLVTGYFGHWLTFGYLTTGQISVAQNNQWIAKHWLNDLTSG